MIMDRDINDLKVKDSKKYINKIIKLKLNKLIN